MINNLASVENSVNSLLRFPSLSFNWCASSMHIILHLNFLRLDSSMRATVGVVSMTWNLWVLLSIKSSLSIIILRSSLDPTKETIVASGNQFAKDSYQAGMELTGATIKNGPGTQYWWVKALMKAMAWTVLPWSLWSANIMFLLLDQFKRRVLTPLIWCGFNSNLELTSTKNSGFAEVNS